MANYPKVADLAAGMDDKLISNPSPSHGDEDGDLRYVAFGGNRIVAVDASPDAALLVLSRIGGRSDTMLETIGAAHRNPPAMTVASGKMVSLSVADTGLQPIDLDQVLGYTLEDARDELMPFFGSLGDVKAYKTALGLSQNFLGQNYKTAKEHPEEPSLVLGLTLFPADKIRHYAELDPGSGVARLIDKVGFDTAHGGTMRTLCTGSNQFCRDSCLVFTGRNVADLYNHRRKAIGAMALLHAPEAFCRVLIDAVERHAKNAPRQGLKPYVRLNVLSDVAWEAVFPGFFDYFGKTPVQFYDYTKVASRKIPGNYDLTFSYSGTNQKLTEAEIAGGRRVAVVFMAMSKDKGKTWEPFRRGSSLPRTFWGLPVVDGDVSDVRPLDPPARGSKRPCIVGLRWKTPGGRAIDPTAPEFKFVVPAYHIRDRVTTEHQNPAGGEDVEYLVAPVTPRFQPVTE